MNAADQLAMSGLRWFPASGGTVTGDIDLALGTNYFGWVGSSIWTAPNDGDVMFSNRAADDAGMLIFGVEAATHPALKRSGATLQARLGDDTNFAGFYSSFMYASGSVRVGGAAAYLFDGRSEIYASADGDLLLTNNAVNDFGLLQGGGTTASFPAWKRDAASWVARLADDSGMCNVSVANLFALGSVRAAATDSFYWLNRSELYAPADGDFQFTDDAKTSGITLDISAGFFDLSDLDDADGTAIELLELSGGDAAAPAANKARIYLKDSGGGKTQLCARFATGAVQVIASEP